MKSYWKRCGVLLAAILLMGAVTGCSPTRTDPSNPDGTDGSVPSEVTEATQTPQKTAEQSKPTDRPVPTDAPVTTGTPTDGQTEKPDKPAKPEPITVEADTDSSWGEIVPWNPDADYRETFMLKEYQSKIKVYGRSQTLETGIACDHIASGIEFRAETAGTVSLRIESNADLYYAVSVNGIQQKDRLQLSKGIFDYDIARGLPKGVYDFKLINETGVAFGRTAIISLTFDGTLLDAPKDQKYLIEFIGDSITSGYGCAEGTTDIPAHFDVTRGYAYQTAQLLNADHSFVAVTGWGILPTDKNADPVKGCIPAIYGKTCPWGREEVSYVPDRIADLVVINLGTNDCGRSNYEADFVSEAVKFVGQVRAMHPGAVIVWAYGQMLQGDRLTRMEQKLQQVSEAVGGTGQGFYTVKLNYNQGALNGHPTAQAQAEAAKILSDWITQNGLLN